MPTAVHVGDGYELQYGFDFLANGKDIYVLDVEKLVDRIGETENLNPEEMKPLLDAISKRKLVEYIDDNDIDLNSISSRWIDNYYNYKFEATNIIQSQVHDAFGRPYIPGSSIKGAIRTAIVATMARDVANKNKYNLKDVEQNLCGRINSDFFRFIRVGDAVFDKGCEIVSSLSRLTQICKHDIKQYIEAIGLGEDEFAPFVVDIDAEKYEKVKQSGLFSKMVNMPKDVQDISSLLKLINDHTIKLVKDEINEWKKYNNNNWAMDYVETMSALLEECNKVDNGKECVLRIGMGSGKRFVTGAWADSVGEFYDEKNKLTCNPIPVTRAFVESIQSGFVDLLGFVKLRIKSVK